MAGIDVISCYVPLYYIDLKDLAEKRNIEYEKLSKGLGVLKSAVPGAGEDAASMAANAALKLILENNIDPSSVGRIYVGTESSLDGAKPIASYVNGMLEKYFEKTNGANCMRHCDAVDMTFACIGATDALLNTVDWCNAGENRVGIVIATDYAKYELNSSGEYTQGAGAVAVLVRKNPRILEIDTNTLGVACKDEHDFYKPVRSLSKEDLVQQILSQLGLADVTISDTQLQQLAIENIISEKEETVQFHKPTPLFDGQFSNQCYADRLREAYQHYASNGGTPVSGWDHIAFHLPYAFHGKRIFNELFFLAHKDNAAFREELIAANPEFDTLNPAEQLKLVSKTPSYIQYCKEKIEPGSKASSEIGNLYTGAVFMSLMSLLETNFTAGKELAGQTIAFCAYGSGSKAKVFSGTVQPQWKTNVSTWNLFGMLNNRQKISFDAYENLHNGIYMLPAAHGFCLEEVTAGTFVRSYGYNMLKDKQAKPAFEYIR